MKKLTFSLIACIACFQALQADAPALTSPVNLSLQHYEAITHTLATNPEFQNVIPEGEFITNLRVQRRSINVTEGNVYVNITTRLPYKKRVVADREETLAGTTEQSQLTSHHSHGRCKNKRGNGGKTYMATLLLTPSSEGTPPSITVVSIEPIVREWKKSCAKEGGPRKSSTPDVVTVE